MIIWLITTLMLLDTGTRLVPLEMLRGNPWIFSSNSNDFLLLYNCVLSFINLKQVKVVHIHLFIYIYMNCSFFNFCMIFHSLSSGLGMFSHYRYRSNRLGLFMLYMTTDIMEQYRIIKLWMEAMYFDFVMIKLGYREISILYFFFLFLFIYV